jgi:molybdopterin/thiamine biosynthesis adenylyltransferase
VSNYLVLFPAEMWEFIDAAGWTWGYLNLRVDRGERVVTISHVWDRNDKPAPFDKTTWQQRHYLRYADIIGRSGVWYRCRPELHDIHDALSRRRHAAIPTDYFRDHLTGMWQEPGADPLPVITVSTPQNGRAGVSAWQVTADGAAPEAVTVVSELMRPTDYIVDQWPVRQLARCTVTIVGVGSIGSVIAEALARAGVGRFAYVDHDRLEQRNLARHRLPDRHLGRLKVSAMHDYIAERYPGTGVEPYPINVLSETDVLRPLAASTDLIICAADGVAPRRVVNHVARRAGTPLILAAVLEDGAFGEIVRVRPQTGCLYCLRLEQVETGAFDPEPGMDLGYGTGTAHRPMTAAPSDLELIGTTAAKTALSTLLEARGRWNQRLPGDIAVVGLQPKPDMQPPFDIEHAGDLRWHQLPGRRDDCPTCAPA